MERISNATAIFLVLISSSLSLLLFFCILHWWSQRQQLPEKEDGDCSQPPELPVVPYSSKGLAYLQECAVCLAELEEGEKVKVIPVCGHVFHPSCIDRWLASSCSCPLCRRCSQIPESSMV